MRIRPLALFFAVILAATVAFAQEPPAPATPSSPASSRPDHAAPGRAARGDDAPAHAAALAHRRQRLRPARLAAERLPRGRPGQHPPPQTDQERALREPDRLQVRHRRHQHLPPLQVLRARFHLQDRRLRHDLLRRHRQPHRRIRARARRTAADRGAARLQPPLLLAAPGRPPHLRRHRPASTTARTTSTRSSATSTARSSTTSSTPSSAKSAAA